MSNSISNINEDNISITSVYLINHSKYIVAHNMIEAINIYNAKAHNDDRVTDITTIASIAYQLNN